MTIQKNPETEKNAFGRKLALPRVKTNRPLTCKLKNCKNAGLEGISRGPRN